MYTYIYVYNRDKCNYRATCVDGRYVAFHACTLSIIPRICIGVGAHSSNAACNTRVGTYIYVYAGRNIRYPSGDPLVSVSRRRTDISAKLTIHVRVVSIHYIRQAAVIANCIYRRNVTTRATCARFQENAGYIEHGC